MYILLFLESFNHTYKSLIKNNKIKENRTKKALYLLKQNPFYPSLKSYKVTTKNYGEKWSSWVTGDLRIIWDFDEEQKIRILIIALATHSGTHKEYK